jgi:putative ABC transport system permease protein
MDVLADFRFTFRNLIRNPAFAVGAVAILALGIGINAAVFTVTNAVLFRGFPHVDPDNRILYLGTRKFGRGFGVSYADFEDWRAQAKSFRGMAVVSNGGLRFILKDPSGAAELCDGTELSANSFRVLGQRPVLGRDFAPSDQAPGAPPVVILNYRFWERQFAKNPSVIGKAIQLNDSPATVIGVMPPDFYFPHRRVDLWLPLAPAPNLRKRETRNLWFAFGRLADAATITTAQAEIDTIGRRLESDYPLTNRDVRPYLTTFQNFLGPNAAVFYRAIWGAVGFVLLIACANLANLLLARNIGRSREVSVRIALGATRQRIMRQFLVESVMLSSVGGAFGWLIAIGTVRAYELFATPPSSYDHWDYALDYRVFAYLVAISIATGLLFGLAPALRLSKLDIHTALKDGSRGATTGRNKRNLSAFLVIGETALAIVLLAGAGLMLRSFLNIYTANLGVDTANLLTASVRLPVARYPDRSAQLAFFDRLATRLNALPGVDSVSLTGSLPGLYAPRFPYELAGAPPTNPQTRPALAAVAIGPNYFRTVGAAVLSGRDFSQFDAPSAIPVAMVNRRFAARFWPGENPIGKRLRLFRGKTPDAWRTVVGIASDIIQNDATGQTFDPVIYIPFRQAPAADFPVIEMDLVARTRVNPARLAPAFRGEIQAIDSGLIIYSGLGSIEGPKPLTESLALNDYWSKGVNAALFLVFATVALLLAAVGLYAVVAHSVSQRTQEIGIRMAVGANACHILKLVFVQGMLPLGFGLILGLAGAVVVTRVLRSELVQVSPADPVTLVVACVVLVLCAGLGCWIPARRALRVDPVVALRQE